MKKVQIDGDDAIWRALANPVRRHVLDILRDGPLTTGEVETALGLSRHVVVQHLAALRAADLVIVEARGRRRLNYLNAVPIQRIHERWVSRYTEPWVSALAGLKHAVESTEAIEDLDEREGRAVG